VTGGDVAELPALCEWLRPQLRRVLARYRIPFEDAEDLVQTTVLLAITKWAEIYSPPAWIVGTLARRCSMYWRAQQVRSRRFMALADLVGEPSTAPAQEQRAILADLARLCGELRPRARAVVLLRHYQGLRPEEVARATGLRRSSLGQTETRALAELRELARDETPARPRRRRKSSGLARWRYQRVERLDTCLPWSEPVKAFLAQEAFDCRTGKKRRDAAANLARAAARLGDVALAELTAEALPGYCTALMADGRAPMTQARELCMLRSFLLWAGEQGCWHALRPEVVRSGLRLPRGYQRPFATWAEKFQARARAAANLRAVAASRGGTPPCSPGKRSKGGVNGC
jgi:RNA polymerase sigma factor (sigma-70 family)